jgi:penicillin-binding protein 1A
MRDAWFIGSTPSLITGVWVGFDQEASLGNQEVGGKAAAPVWLYFMEKFLQNMPVESFPAPEGIVFVKVNSKTGQPSESGTLSEAFLANAQPSERPNDLTEEKEDLFR